MPEKCQSGCAIVFSADADFGCLPEIDEDGNEIKVTLTPEQRAAKEKIQVKLEVILFPTSE